MFSKLYNFFEKCEALRMIPLMLLGFGIIVSFFVASDMANNDKSVPWQITVFFLVSLGTALTGFLPVIDTIIERCVSYVTMGEHKVEHWLGVKLFGEEYASREHPSYHYISKKNGFRGAVIISMVATFSIPITLCILNPTVAPYIAISATIVGLVWGMLALARKVYYINTRLKRHVNDPNAHKA